MKDRVHRIVFKLVDPEVVEKYEKECDEWEGDLVDMPHQPYEDVPNKVGYMKWALEQEHSSLRGVRSAAAQSTDSQITEMYKKAPCNLYFAEETNNNLPLAIA